MQFPAADQAAMLTAMGEDVVINDVTCRGDFRLNGQVADLYNGGVETTGPTVRISGADFTARAVAHESTVVARGVTYSVIGDLPENSGFYLLRLTEV